MTPELWSNDWWSEFLRSPGFGGAAAVLAALIALLSAIARNRTDRRLAREERLARIKEAEAEHWWDLYQWSIKQIDKIEIRTGAILLRALAAQSPGNLEREMVKVATNVLERRHRGRT